MSYLPQAVERADRYKVKVEEYVQYRRTGYLLVRGLVPDAEVRRLLEWAMTRWENTAATQPANAALSEIAKGTRAHQLHRSDPVAEWGLLHPRVLDVLEALIGPDVLALQTMLFYNPPGTGGQGWHQDSYYITTYPDTLIGAWLALEPADETNGCLWVVPGSHCEPIYPPVNNTYAHVHAANAFEDLHEIENASHLDDSVNTLTQVVRKYPPPIAVPMEAGDVLFFEGHLLHRSYPNRTPDRWRRSLVCHYCNARAWVPWNHGAPYEGDSANYLHILARGSTHLPFATPKFGTPVDLYQPSSNGALPPRMMGDAEGNMGMG
ncbi:MAG: syringomycin biosynthesis enzyme [Fimbriimonadales bacterium]|nr:MAG: syringomycin biosynthesis enzyme [Fimbriimonadales bacterium]GIV11223.1 MAG: syringomycin biosynthesis enzyme [Fimbriimonadales bacterium]